MRPYQIAGTAENIHGKHKAVHIMPKVDVGPKSGGYIWTPRFRKNLTSFKTDNCISWIL